jgi:succinylglutamic semialdehyde dehydrogenase
VFNVIQGGGTSGRLLSVHPDVDGVLFTGSAAVGRRIVQDNAARPDRLIALELGGKNASLALDDCDLERTARAVAFAAFATAGQRCTSTSRLIATSGVSAALSERIAQIARGLRVGYPLDPSVFLGPMISEAARANLLLAQERARAAGFSPLEPGGAAEVEGRHGWYARPAVHRAPHAPCAVAGYSDEELFAPDLAVYTVPDLEAAIALANDSRFGLAASVFTRSRAAFEHAAEELRVGVVHHNRSSAGASGRLPFGGLKESGNHRPAGILVGQSCTAAQGVLHAPAEEPGALPTWPGFGK